MFSSKRVRGQASTEYLVILVFVLILALVVGSVMGGFPQLGGGVSARESMIYWSAATIGIPKYTFSASGNKTYVTFRNNNVFTLRVQNVSVNDKTYDVNRTLLPGESYEAKILAVCGSENDKYSYNVSIGYVDVQTMAGYMFNGETPLVGTCQAG